MSSLQLFSATGPRRIVAVYAFWGELLNHPPEEVRDLLFDPNSTAFS
jgi:hypothetical protein